MTERERCYRVLGLTPPATEAEIKQAWKDLVQVWHPDRFCANARLREKAEQKLREINNAYRQLSDTRSGVEGAQSEAASRDDRGPGVRTQAPLGQDSFNKASYAGPGWGRRPGRDWYLLSSSASRIVFVAAVAIGTLFLLWHVEAVIFESSARIGSALNGGHRVDSPSLPTDLSEVARQLASKASNLSSGVLPTTIRVPAAIPAGSDTFNEARDVPSTGAELRSGTVRAGRRSHPGPITSRIPAGVGSLRISNQTGVDAAITVRSETAPRTSLAVIYVSANKTVVVDSIGPGSYLVQVEAGTGWDPNTLRFRHRTFANESVGPFRFTQIQDSEGLQSDRRELVLTPGP